jgi:hypothetical protein
LVGAIGSPFVFGNAFTGTSFILRNGDPLTPAQFQQDYCTTDTTANTITCKPLSETPELKQVFLRGEAQTNTQIDIGGSAFSKLGDFRSSVGLELRVQVPIVNVPFRLIYFYNPGGKFGFTKELPNYPLPGKRSGFRFTVGRTF